MQGALSPHQWDKFIKSQALAHATFNTKPLVFKRAKGRNRSRYGEDPEFDYDIISLTCQANYNVMRTWPITLPTDTGELDRQSVQIFLSKPALKEKGLLKTNGTFNYDPGFDRFEMDGIRYKAFGDTIASQVYEDDLLFTIILRPETGDTGDSNTG